MPLFLPLFRCSLVLLASAAAGLALPGMTPSNNDGQPVPMPSASPDEKGNYPAAPETVRTPSDKKGQSFSFTISNSKIYPGTVNNIQVYIPTGYTPDKPACLQVALDGYKGFEPAVTENLAAKGDMPVTILVGIVPGSIPNPKNPKQALRYNRSYEFDSTNGNFPDFIEKEILPEIEKRTTPDGRPIRISHDAKDHAIEGASTGGIGSFTVAWQRPDLFSRVFSTIGTFVSMRGGDEYPTLIRKTEPKPIRIFLEDGSGDAWNPLFGSWFMANLNIEAALSFAGYDVAHLWGTHGHDGRLSAAIYPNVMRWLWKGWPAPIEPGISNNNMLKVILAPEPPQAASAQSQAPSRTAPKPGPMPVPYQPWKVVDGTFQSVSGLAANADGEVFFSDSPEGVIYKIGADGKPVVFLGNTPLIFGEAFGPDGNLYCTAPGEKKIFAIDSTGKVRDIASGIVAFGITVTSAGEIFVTDPGRHSDEPSTVWQIKPTGEKISLDTGLSCASGIAVSPDRNLLVVPELTTKWIYTWLLGADGTLQDKQRYFWLHMSDIESNSGARDICYDTNSYLYVATNLGIQVCDTNGRVRAILTPPTPCGPIRSVCFGGPGFHTLYATDGQQIFSRVMSTQGYEPWSPPIALPSSGGG